MSELADELALHAQPERVKEIASEKVSEWKEKAKDLAKEKASELKQQAKDAAVDKATELKTRTKEAVMHGTMELKERADTPRGWSLLGAILGAGVGAVLMKKAFTVRESHSTFQRTDIPATGMSGDVSAMGGQLDTSLGGAGIGGAGVWANTSGDTGSDTGVGLKGHATDIAHSVKDKAVAVKDRAMGAVGQVRDQASHLRERLPSGGEVKTRATDWFDRTLESQPLMLALGGIALGMFASMLVPVSSRERQLIEPAKRKAQEGISQLGEQLEQKLQGSTEDVGASGSSVGSSTVGFQGSSLGSSESLMGAERPGFEDEDRSESLASPTGSRIPPLAPLDDVTPKIH